MNRHTAAAIFIVLITASLSQALSLSRMELRCQCINKESRFIHPKNMKNVELIPSGPHCKDVEVIITVKSGIQVCVDPQAPWVKKIINRILESSKADTVVSRKK
ncbi:interleukin-8-like [Protopterus annectens]|uniref:interleukin-8-like n=1 Tax=Protopterus annectens TaxID=7888 RepID=UPI001CFB420A|nr:interleukin-8-like [Protopterus annectens]